MKMGDRIRELRLANGMTQEELGEKVGVKRAAINKYELGYIENIPQATIAKLAQVFGVRPSYILCMDEETSEIDEYLEELKNRPEMRTLFSAAKSATKEDIERAVAIIEALKNQNG